MSCVEQIHINDPGIQFLIEFVDCDGAAEDISTATVKQVLIRKSDYTVLTKDAAFYTDGSDGLISYVTASGDLNLTGNYQLQGYVVMPSGSYHSSKESFRVYDNLG